MTAAHSHQPAQCAAPAPAPGTYDDPEQVGGHCQPGRPAGPRELTPCAAQPRRAAPSRGFGAGELGFSRTQVLRFRMSGCIRSAPTPEHGLTTLGDRAVVVTRLVSVCIEPAGCTLSKPTPSCPEWSPSPRIAPTPKGRIVRVERGIRGAGPTARGTAAPAEAHASRTE